MGMGLGPIPWSSIVRWAEVHGLTDLHEIYVLNRFVRAMEDVDRELEDAKDKKGA